ncbi:MAG: hypothetical protein K1X55_13295 [Chitinophagales bacterium]|nr:hypothetical protein [Chitinophagales bacterium]
MLFIKPIAILITALFSVPYIYSFSNGYVFEELGISIVSGCAGFNLYVILLSALAYFWSCQSKPIGIFLVGLPLSIIATLLFAFSMNFMRVASSIIMKKSNIIPGLFDTGFAHQTLGAIIFIGSIILFSHIAQQIFKNNIYEKIPQP